MPGRGMAAGIMGRAAKTGSPKVVASPIYHETAPDTSGTGDAGPLAPQPGPQTAFLSCGADIVFYGGGAGGGKAIHVDTPVPTPNGWTTMGALIDGDMLFDERGQLCRVLRAHPIIEQPESYRLTFSDGTTLTACADHLWRTYTAAELKALTRNSAEWRAKRRASRVTRGAGGKKSARFTETIRSRNAARAVTYESEAIAGAVRTTKEIFRSVRTPRGRVNHAIPVAGALHLPESDLPMDPYVLGAWMGDGGCATGVFTCDDRDAHTVEQMRAAGYDIRRVKANHAWYARGMVQQLRTIGVFGNKHIPAIYLRSSAAQRLALLQGLMDTDGTIRETGRCDFDNTNRQLAEAVFELVASLGMQPFWTEGRARLRGKDCGPRYRVTFTPSLPVFRLPRKVQRLPASTRRTTRFRYITECVPCDPVPMRCITVDSPSRLFLCTRAMIPTHNTAALVMEATRHHHVPDFTAVYFRRSYTEIFMPKGIWDEAKKVYTRLGWTPRVGDAEWVTPAGGRVVFAHLQHEDTVDNWKSAQIALICFDQLETFTEHQFFYMLSRNRSTCGVRPYIRASFNPEPGWLADLLQWWWDPATGYAIKERGGVIRWMARISGEIHWADTREALVTRFGPECEPLSVTFIPALLDDNKILQRLDPGYRAKLLAMPIVEQERLLRGNFKIRPSAGKVLPRGRFVLLTELPKDIVRVCRGWDNAATQGGGDWSSAVKLGVRANGRYIILHRWRDQLATGARDKAMQDLAILDGVDCEIAIAQEPGSAGKDVVFYTVTGMAGWTVAAYRDTGDKVTRSMPFASQLMAGNVDCFVWDPLETEAFLAQVDAFPTRGVADDDVDGLTKAFKHLTHTAMLRRGWGEDEEFSLV